ncbi:MAG: putative quinol monooxygenase [Fusobacteriaceae bacterium]
MIRVVVPILVKEGMKEEFLKIAQPLIEASREEKGCIEYFLLDSGVENKLFFVELWETEADLKNHSQAPHSKKYGELLGPLKSSNSSIEIYETKN